MAANGEEANESPLFERFEPRVRKGNAPKKAPQKGGAAEGRKSKAKTGYRDRFLQGASKKVPKKKARR